MTANHRAAAQLMTLGVLNAYIRTHGYPPPVTELAKLRHMCGKSIRLHMLYLQRQGYIVQDGWTWQQIRVTEKGRDAA